ncbi:hypothetical protein [Thalassobium sp. R2A62]|jgi:small-conductance mechanosensitive channel|uniref:hypothetical protein n=1 Tax=Thalassobium sp. R2A62 TaxID=633131 RepID=UPI0001B1CC5E|nr:hypothetical protein [Thalassobium sp. R2A62]EET47421.1 mechanosensitive ion channel family protein [Thalassobium sp. R2A62]
MNTDNEMIAMVMGYFNQAWELAQTWLLSPAAWSQFAMLIGAYLLARLVNRIVTPRLTQLLTLDAASTTALSNARRFLLIFLPLLLPLFAYGFTAIGEIVTRSIFGSGAVVAFGKRVFLFLAVRASDVLFLVWNALKDEGIQIPYPHRVVEIKGAVPTT